MQRSHGKFWRLKRSSTKWDTDAKITLLVINTWSPEKENSQSSFFFSDIPFNWWDHHIREILWFYCWFGKFPILSVKATIWLPNKSLVSWNIPSTCQLHFRWFCNSPPIKNYKFWVTVLCHVTGCWKRKQIRPYTFLSSKSQSMIP